MIKIEMECEYEEIWVSIDALGLIDRRVFDTAIAAVEFLKQWLTDNYWRY